MAQRRSSVSRSKIDNDKVESYWSLNLQGVRFYFTLFVLVATVISISFGAVQVTGKQIFKKQLDDFHRVAIPLVEEKIDIAIRAHRIEAELKYNRDLAILEKQLAVITEHLENSDKAVAKMERMIERMYIERYGDG